MVDRNDAEAAVTALRMVIAGLAEQMLDLVAAPEPDPMARRIAALEELARLGRDIARTAESATVALRRTENASI